MADQIIKGESVDVIGCKNPELLKTRISLLVEGRSIEYKPIFNGMGRKLGKMVRQEDDIPSGFSFFVAHNV